MKNHLLLTTLASALVAVLFFACDNKPAPAAQPDENITLETAVWQLTELPMEASHMQVPDSLPVPLTVKFSNGNVEGFGGCNTFGGTYTANGNQLKIGDLISTKMFCQDISNWEGAFLHGLQSSQSYSIEGERLEISTDGQGKLVFRLNWKKR